VSDLSAGLQAAQTLTLMQNLLSAMSPCLRGALLRLDANTQVSQADKCAGQLLMQSAQMIAMD